MKNIPVKANISAGDDTGSPTAFGANELNSIANELENTVTSTGQTLSTGQTPDTNVTQLARALVIAGQSAMSYNDSGAVNAYVLTAVVATLIQPISYFNGMLVSFTPDNANTGTSTINISTLGSKAIRTVADANIVAGDLITTRIYNLVYISSYASGAGAFVIDNSIAVLDAKYVPNNVDLLLRNVISATPGEAKIGAGYQGIQSYGEDASGDQRYGRGAVGDQYYGLGAIGDQYYGRNALGAIEIGSTSGTAATKKLISGAKEATFEEIIDAGLGNTDGAWQTPTLLSSWAQGGSPLRYRLTDSGRYLRIFGVVSGTSATAVNLFTLPTGWIPSGYSGNTFFLAFSPNLSGDSVGTTINGASVSVVLQSNINNYPTGLIYIDIKMEMVAPA